MSYKDVVFKSLGGGLNTQDELSKVPMNYSPDMQNVVFDTGGSIEVRKGSSLLGVGTIVGYGVRSLHNFRRRDGMEIPFKTISTQVQYYNRQTSAWSLLSAGYTIDKQFDFADYNQYTYFANGVESLYRWNGQYGKVTDAHAASATALEVTAEGGTLNNWLSAGEAIVGTQPIYYGSKTSGTLQSVTGLSATVAVNAEIAQTAVSSRGFTSVSSCPKGNILHVDSDILYIAGLSADGQTFAYSNVGDPTDFTYAAGAHVDGQGGEVVVADNGGYITGLTSRDDGEVIVMKQKSIKKFTFTEAYNKTAFPKLKTITQSDGAVTDKCIQSIDGEIIYISPINGVKDLFQSTTGLAFVTPSEFITPTMESLSLLSACSLYHRNKYYLGAKESGNTNNVVYMFDRLANEKKGAWTKMKGWNVNDFMVFDGNAYLASSISDDVLLMNTGYADNSYPYTCYYKTPQVNFGIPHEAKRTIDVFVEGYVNNGCVLSATGYYDGLSGTAQTKVIYGNGAYVDPTNTLTFGDSLFADSSFAGVTGSADVIVNKFRVRMRFTLRNFFNFQLMFKSDKAGSTWRVDQLVPYVEKESSDIFPISSII